MKKIAIALAGVFLAGTAAAAPDWSKVPSRSVTVFHPGTSGLEWIMKGTDHGGAKGISKGERCTGCHEVVHQAGARSRSSNRLGCANSSFKPTRPSHG